MSASFKPPRKKSGPAPPSNELVARILVDADTLGDGYAAKRHKVSERTVRNYRTQYENDPNVAELCRTFLSRINDGWIDSARAARLRLIERQLELAEAKTASLPQVTNALRRTNEIVMAHEILNDPDDDDQHHLADQPEDPREDETSDDAEGGGEVLED